MSSYHLFVSKIYLQFLYFLITYGVCKKRQYCNRMSKKNSLLLMNVHILYVLEDKTSKKTSVRLSVCLSVWMYGYTWTFAVDTITSEGFIGS